MNLVVKFYDIDSDKVIGENLPISQDQYHNINALKTLLSAKMHELREKHTVTGEIRAILLRENIHERG